MVIEGGVCHTYLLMEFQEMDPQRGIYQEAYSWSLELCGGFAEIEIFGQMESRFQNKFLFLRCMQKFISQSLPDRDARSTWPKLFELGPLYLSLGALGEYVRPSQSRDRTPRSLGRVSYVDFQRLS